MIKLIMFPYAGSIGYAYQKIFPYFDKGQYDIHMIDLNGRGERIEYKPYSTWNQLVDDIFVQVIEIIKRDENEYVLFGHSMGAKIAYDVYLKLSMNKIKAPLYIIFSGCKIHSEKSEYNKLLEMPKQDFEQEYIRLGGIPKEVLHDDDFREYVFDVIKQDLQLLVQYLPKLVRITENVIVLNGANDDKSSISDWKYLCNKRNRFSGRILH